MSEYGKLDVVNEHGVVPVRVLAWTSQRVLESPVRTCFVVGVGSVSVFCLCVSVSVSGAGGNMWV